MLGGGGWRYYGRNFQWKQHTLRIYDIFLKIKNGEYKRVMWPNYTERIMVLIMMKGLKGQKESLEKRLVPFLKYWPFQELPRNGLSVSISCHFLVTFPGCILQEMGHSHKTNAVTIILSYRAYFMPSFGYKGNKRKV